MSRRFSVRSEIRRHNRAFTDFAQEAGTYVRWYRFDSTESQTDPVYDEENTEFSNAWHDPRNVLALSIVTAEGGEISGEGGGYTTDLLRGWFAVEHLQRAQLPDIDTSVLTERRLLKDRIVYGGVVWSPTRIDFGAHIRDYDLTFILDAEEVDPDELVNDSTFAEYAAKH